MILLLLRHGESTANATHEDTDDPDLTPLGEGQADAWRAAAPAWGLDSILVSPLLRCIQTAARALGLCGGETRWRLAAEAREHWWHMRQSRGRLGGALAPLVAGLPFADAGALSLEPISAPSEFWDPAGEAAASKRDLKSRSRRASLDLVGVLAAKARDGERMVAVVCHWGVISALTDVDAKNCSITATLWAPHDAESAVESALKHNTCAQCAREQHGWSYTVLGTYQPGDDISFLHAASATEPLESSLDAVS
ncbi:histidine phosphatase superfamily [Pelagophyceae sp. CCMP2097]|nr:histidine phosphatase superfamily [Pelagophyceae sp. CCMP2097]